MAQSKHTGIPSATHLECRGVLRLFACQAMELEAIQNIRASVNAPRKWANGLNSRAAWQMYQCGLGMCILGDEPIARIMGNEPLWLVWSCMLSRFVSKVASIPVGNFDLTGSYAPRNQNILNTVLKFFHSFYRLIASTMRIVFSHKLTANLTPSKLHFPSRFPMNHARAHTDTNGP